MTNKVYGVFVAIVNNHIECLDFNVADFYKAFLKYEKHFDLNYQALYRRFATREDFDLTINDKIYHFQCIILKPQAKRKKEKEKRKLI